MFPASAWLLRVSALFYVAPAAFGTAEASLLLDLRDPPALVSLFILSSFFGSEGCSLFVLGF